MLPKYYVQDSHEPIIDKDTFERVQEKLKTKAANYNPGTATPNAYPFSGKMICGQCVKNYRRKITGAGSKYAKPVWICPTFNRHGKAACQAKQIPEEILLSLTAEVLGIPEFDEAIFKAQIKEMKVFELNEVFYILHNGREVKATWQDKSRKWSEEAKQQAREHQLEFIKRRDNK